MSAREALQAALLATLRDDARIAGELTQIFDAPPMRAVRPYALIDEAMLVDWSTKDMAGREGRVAVTLFDQGERPVRARRLSERIEATLTAMPGDLGDGWRIVTLMLIRSRLSREGNGRWTATSEFRVRMLKEDAV